MTLAKGWGKGRRAWLARHWLPVVRISAVSGLLLLGSLQVLQLCLLFKKVGYQTPAVSIREQAAQHTDLSALISSIQTAHLFGMANEPTSGATGGATRNDVSVMGIAYSSEEKDSVAVMMVAGAPAVCHVGTQLATGKTVTAISLDKVQLTGPDGVVTVTLDIPQADPNERVSPGVFSMTSAIGDGASGQNIVSGTAPISPADAFSPTPTHYVSLKSLRGPGAANRFKQLDLPKIYKGKPHH